MSTNKVLEALTPEMEALIPLVRDEWINRVYTTRDSVDINKAQLTKAITWLYTLGEYAKPKIHIVDSPMAAQKLANTLMRKHDKKHKDTFFSPSWAFGIMNYSWVAFYDFFTRIGIVNNENFNKYMEYSKLNVYDTIQFDTDCIVTKLPTSVKSTIYRTNRVPHCASDPAITFADGFSLYYWNGTIVPEHWIIDKGSITKEEILGIENAETRRCLMEILGAKDYYDKITDGKGLTLLDEDTDLQGNPMRLYQTKSKDTVANEKIQFLEVVDPSTGRVYNIYPPKQNAKNVWDAKAQTFSNKNLYVRQGDVGLVRSDFTGTHPIAES